MKPNVSVGDIIETKKPHPCGANRWKILRTGVDFKLKCENCSRIIMLEYEDFVKRYKKTIEKSSGNDEQ